MTVDERHVDPAGVSVDPEAAEREVVLLGAGRQGLLGVIVGGHGAHGASAVAEKENADAVLRFVTDDMLAAVRPESMPHTTVRDAVVKSMIAPAAARAERQFAGKPLVEAAVRHTLGVTLRVIGRADLALPHFDAAQRLRERQLGRDHPDTLNSLASRAVTLSSLGRVREAEPLYKGAPEHCTRVLGRDHPQTLTALNNYAYVLHALGRTREAEPLYRDTLERRTRVLGPDHPETINALSIHATALVDLGRRREAEPLSKDAYERHPRTLGPDHPDTLHSLNNYASNLSWLGRANEAEALYQDALDRRTRVLGANHPETLSSLSNYGLVLRLQGRPTDAEPLIRDVLGRRTRALGDDHPDTLSSLNDYAVVFTQLGRATEAEPLARDAWGRRTRVLGAAHPDTLTSLNHYASVLDALGRWKEAADARRSADPAALRRAEESLADALRRLAQSLDGGDAGSDGHRRVVDLAVDAGWDPSTAGDADRRLVAAAARFTYLNPNPNHENHRPRAADILGRLGLPPPEDAEPARTAATGPVTRPATRSVR